MVLVERLFGEYISNIERRLISGGWEHATNCPKEELEAVKADLQNCGYRELRVVEPVFYGNGERIEGFVGVYHLPPKSN